MLAVLASIVITTVAGPTGAGAAPPPSVNLGPLRPVSCKTLPSDPPLEAPLYAQNAGASPMADGWWCQLPHPTRMPASFVAVQREVIPLPNLYGLYSTTYSLPLLILALLALGATIVGAAALYRRASLRSAYLLTTAPLIVFTILGAEAAGRLFPAWL